MSMLCPSAFGNRRAADTDTAPLEPLLDAIEGPLAALGAALRDRDGSALERHAAELKRALAAAIPRLATASPIDIAPALRQRLLEARGSIAAQRDSLARGSAAIERGLGVLIPAALPVAVYGNHGHSERAASSGCVHA